MPQAVVRYYKTSDDVVPLAVWLAALGQQSKKQYAICIAMLKMLQQEGYALRRPRADILRNKIHELRDRDGKVRIRILYFFDERERNVAIVTHGFAKEDDKQQDDEIDQAVSYRADFLKNPDAHAIDRFEL